MSKKDLTPGGVITSNPAKAPRQIARYAQAVLLLFAVASIIAGWSGDKLATVVLTAVIVIGFMVALLGFVRLSNAGGGYYARLAIVLTTAVLVAVIVLFMTVLFYIATGNPVWLDTFFGNQTPPAPSASIEQKNSRSLTVNLAAYPVPDGTIQVVIFDAQGNPVGSSQSFDATLDSFVLSNLEPATRYRVRVTAIVRKRPSAPHDIVTATDAEGMLIKLPVSDGVFQNAYYTGSVNPDLIPDADAAKIEFREAGVSWIYWGPVREGLPSGKGRALGCELAEFESGKLSRSDCIIPLNPAAYREKDSTILTEGGSVYMGGVVGASGPTINTLGPYPVEFDGEGTLESEDVIISGNWRASAVEGDGVVAFANGLVRTGTFEQGLLKEGLVLGEQLDDVTMSYEVNRFAPTGAASVLSPRGFSFGVMSRADPRGPYSMGYSGQIMDDEFVLTLFEGDNPRGVEFRPILPPTSQDCQTRETFGMNVDTSAMFKKGWRLSSTNHLEGTSESPGEPPDYEVWLELMPADIHVYAFRYQGETADIRFWVGNNFDPAQQIEIDGKRIETNSIQARRQPHAGLTVARLCRGKEVTNLTNGKSVQIEGLCPALALMLGRTYYCAPKPEKANDSPWQVESKIGNWAVSIRKEGNDPDALTAVEGRAELGTTTDGLDFNIILSCRLSGVNVFGLALWGPDLTGASVGDTVEFKFSSNGAENTFNLPMRRGGVFEIINDVRQPIFELLKATETLTRVLK